MSELENKQKTVLGVALPEESEFLSLGIFIFYSIPMKKKKKRFFMEICFLFKFYDPTKCLNQ